MGKYGLTTEKGIYPEDVLKYYGGALREYVYAANDEPVLGVCGSNPFALLFLTGLVLLTNIAPLRSGATEYGIGPEVGLCTLNQVDP
jgi:hypothetical protein